MSSDASRQQVDPTTSSVRSNGGSSLHKSSSASRMMHSSSRTGSDTATHLPFVSIEREQQPRTRPSTSTSVRVIDHTSSRSSGHISDTVTHGRRDASLGAVTPRNGVSSPTSSVVSPIFSTPFGAAGAQQQQQQQQRASADPVKFFSSTTRSRCIDTTSLLFGSNTSVSAVTPKTASSNSESTLRSTAKGGPCIQIPIETIRKPQPSSAWSSHCGSAQASNSNVNVAAANSASSNNSTLDKYLFQSSDAGANIKSNNNQQQQKKQQPTAARSGSHNSSFNYNGTPATSSTPVHTDFGGVGGDAYNFSARNSATASNKSIDNQSSSSSSNSSGTAAKSTVSHIETINQIARDLIALQQTEAQQQQQQQQSQSYSSIYSSSAALEAAKSNKTTSSSNIAVSGNAAPVTATGASVSTSSSVHTTQKSGGGGGGGSDHSEILRRMLGADNPIEVQECEQVCAAGVQGVYVNKSEAAQWSGEQPLNAYELNGDMTTAQVIRKKPDQTLHYTQDVNVRYLKPPQPAPPGDLIIRQEPDRQLPAAPPLVIRQTPPRPKTPEPIVLRERPPKAPQPVPTQVITVPGKVLPAPPRRIVVEKLPELPVKPQPVIIERWLPYEKMERRIVYEKAPPLEPPRPQPTNLIIEWQTPDVECERELTHLGVFETDPCEYERQYAASLIDKSQLPAFVLDIKPPSGVRLAADTAAVTSESNFTHQQQQQQQQYRAISDDSLSYDLVGDLDALRLVDLHKEGLNSYRSYLIKRGVLAENQAQLGSSVNINNNNNNNRSATHLASLLDSANTSSTYHSMSSSSSSSSTTTTTFGKPCTASVEAAEAAKHGDKSEATLLGLIEEIFKSIDKTRSGFIHVDDAERVLLRLSSRFGRRYRDEDVYSLFRKMSSENNTCISLAEFQRAFLNLNF